MQRIVAGELRGRKLLALPARLEGVRPTSSRVRSAIFDRLQVEVLSAHVLDLCAGTGALAIEALSRGAQRATLVEADPDVAVFLKRQLALLGLTERAQVVVSAAQDFLRKHQAAASPWNLVLLDPPYSQRALYLEIAIAIVQCPAVANDAIVVCEHERPQKGGAPLYWPRALALDARREHGSTWLDFLRVIREPNPEPTPS